MHQKSLFTFLICLFPLFFQAKAETQQKDAITLFAASSLTHVMEETLQTFEQETGVLVEANYASSSVLAKQILAGANPDLFFSANQDWMNLLEKKELIVSDSKIDLLSNTLVLITHKESKHSLKGWQELDKTSIQSIAVGDPDHVPVGIYAQKILSQLNVWDSIQKKVIPTLNTRATVALVEQNEVDCGIVYRTDPLFSKKVIVCGVLPITSETRIVYSIAQIQGMQNNVLTKKFLKFLLSNKAKSIFEKYQFHYLR